MLKIHFRGFISILLSLAFLVVVFTGLILWLSHAPETFGLGKGVWKHCHIFVSLLMLLAGLLHFWLNWSVYWSYLWQQSSRRLNQRRELVLALAITAAVVCMASLGGHGDMGRLFGMSLREIAEKSGKPVDQMVSSLKKEGIAVHDPGDSVLEIAQHNGSVPDAVLDALHRAMPEAMASVRGEH
jgi:hypothetical protein